MPGHNIGENYVMDNSGMMNILQQGINRSVAEAKLKATQRQTEINDLNKQIEKISPKGLASQDLPEFNKKMDELKDAYYQYRNAGTDANMRSAKMEVDNKWRDTFNYAQTAADQRAKLIPLAAHYAAHPELYDDKVLKDISSEIAKPITQVDFAKVDPLNRERKVDASKVDAAVQKDIQALLPGTAEVTKAVPLPGQKGMKGRTVIQNVKEVDPTHVATVIQNHYRKDDDFKKMLQDQFGKQTQDPLEQMALYQHSLPKEIYTKYEKPQVQTNQPIIIKTPKSGTETAASQARLYTQQQVHGILDGDKNAIERLVGVVNGKVSYADKNKNLSISKKGNLLVVDVPAIIKGANPIPEQRHFIDTSTDRGKQEFGALYQSLTGEKVAPSVLNTYKGKKLVSQKAPVVDLGGDNKAFTSSNNAQDNKAAAAARKGSAPKSTSSKKKGDPLGLGL